MEKNEVLEEILDGNVHNYTNEKKYCYPEEKILQERLEWFKDQKLALMVHFGIYCNLGIVASWALNDIPRDFFDEIDWTDDSKLFKEQYVNLNRSFNPIRYNADEWADMASKCGFKYLIFTTKHHDGFCLWDTKYTDYKVTNPDCPYSLQKNSDIIKNTFDAFRNKNLGIAAYFSKADWHSEYYWNKDFLVDKPYSQGPSYDTSKYPEIWDNFRQFTKNQILELCSDYGKLDVMWLDAGWVRKEEGQDLNLEDIIGEARKKQPWLLAVDRTVGGKFENYITPEQCIPDKALDIPWESCISLGVDFGYRFGDNYKSAREVICRFIEIVAKGGNLALNISPQPDGRIPVEIAPILDELGNFINTYSEAIFSTRICEPYFVNNIGFTQKNGDVYAICLYKDENEKVKPQITLPYKEKVSKIELLDTLEEVTFTQTDDKFVVDLPDSKQTDKAPIAIVFKITK